MAESIPGFPAETPGAVCHRLGLGPLQPRGQSWDYGVGVSATFKEGAALLCPAERVRLFLREGGSTSA